jgi:hypothetical protein
VELEREARPAPGAGDGGAMHIVRLSLLVCVCGGMSSCSEASTCLRLPCPYEPAVTLQVRDAVDGGPVSNPVANGIPCGSSGSCIPRQADGGVIGAGTSSIDVTAAGYGHVQLDVNVPAAAEDPCSCQPEYVPQTRDVLLPPH